MPDFLEKRLASEAAKKGIPAGRQADRYVYGAMNNLGAMSGNKVTPKGRAMERKHVADVKAGKAAPMPHPHKNLGTYLHPKKGR